MKKTYSCFKKSCIGSVVPRLNVKAESPEKALALYVAKLGVCAFHVPLTIEGHHQFDIFDDTTKTHYTFFCKLNVTPQEIRNISPEQFWKEQE